MNLSSSLKQNYSHPQKNEAENEQEYLIYSTYYEVSCHRVKWEWKHTPVPIIGLAAEWVERRRLVPKQLRELLQLSLLVQTPAPL